MIWKALKNFVLYNSWLAVSSVQWEIIVWNKSQEHKKKKVI